jgi:hypothetical protein
MKKLIAKKDFSIDGKFFIKDEPVEIRNIDTIKKLNEKGFIYPLELKDLIVLEREFKSNIKEEE